MGFPTIKLEFPSFIWNSNITFPIFDVVILFLLQSGNNTFRSWIVKIRLNDQRLLSMELLFFYCWWYIRFASKWLKIYFYSLINTNLTTRKRFRLIFSVFIVCYNKLGYFSNKKRSKVCISLLISKPLDTEACRLLVKKIIYLVASKTLKLHFRRLRVYVKLLLKLLNRLSLI